MRSDARVGRSLGGNGTHYPPGVSEAGHVGKGRKWLAAAVRGTGTATCGWLLGFGTLAGWLATHRAPDRQTAGCFVIVAIVYNFRHRHVIDDFFVYRPCSSVG